MIRYVLLCDSGHEFEGWFRSSDDFDRQAEDGLLECPSCGSDGVRKAIMAPAVARSAASRTGESLSEMRASIAAAVARARDHVEKNFDYVGERFPEEARRIHYGETEARGVYGEAKPQEVKALVDEGIAVAPLPAPKKTDRAAEAPRAAGRKKLN